MPELQQMVSLRFCCLCTLSSFLVHQCFPLSLWYYLVLAFVKNWPCFFISAAALHQRQPQLSRTFFLKWKRLSESFPSFGGQEERLQGDRSVKQCSWKGKSIWCGSSAICFPCAFNFLYPMPLPLVLLIWLCNSSYILFLFLAVFSHHKMNSIGDFSKILLWNE